MAGRVMVRDGLFTDGDAPALLGSRCAACGAHHFPRHDTCPYCAAEGPLPAQLGGAGRLWAWTAVTAAPPGYRGPVPYGVGVVELEEGIRVITHLTVSDPAALALGLRGLPRGRSLASFIDERRGRTLSGEEPLLLTGAVRESIRVFAAHRL